MKVLLAFSIGLMIFVSAAVAMESDDQGNIYSPPPGAEVYITQEPITGTTNDDYILMIEPWLAGETHTLMQDLWIREDLCQPQIWDPINPPEILGLSDDPLHILVGTSPKSWEEAVQNMLAYEAFLIGGEYTFDIDTAFTHDNNGDNVPIYVGGTPGFYEKNPPVLELDP